MKTVRSWVCRQIIPKKWIDHIPILETAVNRFRQQIILVEHKEGEFEISFRNRRVFVKKADIENGSVNNLLRKYLNKGKDKVGIFSDMNDNISYKRL